MQDINKPLRQAYYALLAGNVSYDGVNVPVRYPMLAQGDQANNYILISMVQSQPFNGDTTNFSDTFITLTIVTRALKNNSGDAADDIAGQIFALLYSNPQPQQILLMTNGQCVNTTVRTDIIQPYLSDGQRVILNRVITFHHIIQHATVSTPGNIYYGTQDTTADPTDFTHNYLGNADNPIVIDYGGVPNPKVFWVAYPHTSQPKTNWQDLNNDLNGGEIGSLTSAFEIRTLTIMGVLCWLIINRYVTGFSGDPAELKYF
jgi:hypothetical protein